MKLILSVLMSVFLLFLTENVFSEVLVEDVDKVKNIVTIKIQGNIKYTDDVKFTEILNEIYKKNQIIKNIVIVKPAKNINILYINI